MITTFNHKTRNANLLICLACLAFAITGCKKEGSNPTHPTTATVTGPYLYVGGGTPSKGFYWKTSLSQTLANFTVDTLSTSGRIMSIVTSGKDVYMAGQTPGYWKDNTFVPVTGASSIEYLSTNGTDVYSTGFDNFSNLAYWIDNSETNLGNTIGRNLFPYQGVATYNLSGIAISGTNALVTGSMFFENEPFSPPTAPSGNFGLLWTNGSVKLFGQGYYITSFYNNTAGVVVSGNDVYVAGIIPDSTRAGGYWKNGTWNVINSAFHPSSITTSGNDIYISGYTFSSSSSQIGGAYWKNGTLVNFLLASSVSAIAVNGADLYILGIDTNNNNVVWKNGAVFETLGSASSQWATCIAIGN